MKKLGIAFVIFLSFLPLLFIGNAYASSASDYTFKLNSITKKNNIANDYWYSLNVSYTNKGATNVTYWIDITGTSSKGSINTWTSETLDSSGNLVLTIYDENLSGNILSLTFTLKVHMDLSDSKANVKVDLSNYNGSKTTPTTTTKTTTSNSLTTTANYGNTTTTTSNSYSGRINASLIKVSSSRITLLIENNTSKMIQLGWVKGSEVKLVTKTKTYFGNVDNKYSQQTISPYESKEVTINIENDITNVNQVEKVTIDSIKVLDSSGLPESTVEVDVNISDAEYSRSFFEWVKDNYVFVLIIAIPVLLLILYLIFKHKKKKNNNNNNNSGGYYPNNHNDYSNSSFNNSKQDYSSSVFNKDYNDTNYNSNNYQNNYSSSSQPYSNQTAKSKITRYANNDISKRRAGTGSYITAIGFYVFALVAYFGFARDESFKSSGGAFSFLPYLFVIFGVTIGTIVLFLAIRKSAVKLNGKTSVGVVKDMYVRQRTENNGGAVSTYYEYYIEFEFEDEYGDLANMVQIISHGIYKSLKLDMQIPIKVYKKDAIFDKKTYKQHGYKTISTTKTTYSVKRKIFISYRREGGIEAAELLKYKLSEYHHVFMDANLGMGDWLQQLLRQIDDCEVFLLILSKDSLIERENDIYFTEIRRAIEKGKNIIPVILGSFDREEDNIYWKELSKRQGVIMQNNQPDFTEDAVRRINELIRKQFGE